jgi:uncharacterized SAM-binding protein YcdF (DUF218 family)
MTKLIRRLLALCLLLLALWLSAPWFLNGLADHLIVRDPLAKADVILVLSGDTNGERAAAGIELYKEGWAKHILMSGGTLAWNLTSADWMKKQAVESGVPAAAVLTQDRSQSTIDDARFSLPIIKARRFRSVILVTSPYHSRRAAAVFKKLYRPAGISVIVYPVPHSVFDPHDWWTRHEDTGFVVWEYVARVMYLLKGY